MEAGNGFEIWRQLYRQYAGGGDAVRYGDQMRLKDWPKCNDIMKLEEHLNGWKACLDEHGAEMYAAPGMLRTMLMGILPEEIEKEVNDKEDELDDHESIIAFIKKRLERKRQKKLADYARQAGGKIINSISDSSQRSEINAEPRIEEPIGEAVPPPPTAGSTAVRVKPRAASSQSSAR